MTLLACADKSATSVEFVWTCCSDGGEGGELNAPFVIVESRSLLGVLRGIWQRYRRLNQRAMRRLPAH
jgi:hypothetical protein